MPSPRRVLSRAAAADLVAKALVGPSDDLFGIEIEWPVHRVPDCLARPSHAELQAVTAEPLPCGSHVTIEPGGQVELSTAPTPNVDTMFDNADVDANKLHARLCRHGLATTQLALDTRRPPQRIVRLPRYDAMDQFFAAHGHAGSWMMCNSAALHVNISHQARDLNRRWTVAHRLGPVLVATFASSPGFDQAGRRWESLRQAIWWSIDPGRTRPPALERSLPEAWFNYALAADVMLIRSEDATHALPMVPGFSFGRWLAEGHMTGWPTADDLQYHLTTLFPPVRPRRWLELRMLDALPPDLREVATMVAVTALTTDAGLELHERLPATAGLWRLAARHALAHPVLAAAARVLFDTVRSYIGTVTAVRWRRDAVHDFTERFVCRRLSPAQQLSDSELLGRLAPKLQSQVPTPCGAPPVLRTPAPTGAESSLAEGVQVAGAFCG